MPADIANSLGKASQTVLRRSLAVPAALARVMKQILPKRLYARSLLIVIAPMVILQGVIVFVFMEKSS